MKTSIVIAAIAALCAGAVHAQMAGPGEDRGPVRKPSSISEKAAAKKARKAEGVATARLLQTGEHNDSLGRAKIRSKAERKVDRENRRAAGIEATKEPRDISGPN